MSSINLTRSGNVGMGAAFGALVLSGLLVVTLGAVIGLVLATGSGAGSTSLITAVSTLAGSVAGYAVAASIANRWFDHLARSRRLVLRVGPSMAVAQYRQAPPSVDALPVATPVKVS